MLPPPQRRRNWQQAAPVPQVPATTPAEPGPWYQTGRPAPQELPSAHPQHRPGSAHPPEQGRPHSVATRLAPWRTQSRSGDLVPPHGCQGSRAVYQLPFEWCTRPRSRDTVPAARLCCRKSAAHDASAPAASSSRSRETTFLVGWEHESTDEAGCGEWHCVRSDGVETSVASVS